VEEGSRKVAFLFPGQGSQYAGMGQELYQKEKAFRQALQQCAEILKPELGIDLCAALYQEASGEVEQTWLAQPGLFAVEYGMAQLWMSWGVEPQALLGHSLGEYTAACLAGVMSLEEALGVVVVRGQLMQRLPLGGMLAVGMGEAQVGRMLKEGVSLAAINAADLCVVSGRLEAIERLEKELQEGGVSCKRLRTSHAFHHAMVEPILGAFLEKMRQVRLRAPGLPFISNVSGRWIQDQEAQDPEYWVKHLRQPVQFERGLKQLVQGEEWMLVEAGPGQGLKRLAQKQGAGRVVATMPGSGAGGSETETMLRAVGQLWSEGVHVNWQAFHAGVRRNRIPLPTYPFERKRYWIDPPPAAVENQVEEQVSAFRSQAETTHYSCRPALRNSYVPPNNEAENQAIAILERALGIRPIGVTDQYGELGGDSLTAIKIIDQLNATFRCGLTVVDLYEGLAVRDLVRLIQNGSTDMSDAVEESGKSERRRAYQTSRRSLHQVEPA
jgi:acyl transferase domain-containing protein